MCEPLRSVPSNINDLDHEAIMFDLDQHRRDSSIGKDLLDNTIMDEKRFNTTTNHQLLQKNQNDSLILVEPP